MVEIRKAVSAFQIGCRAGSTRSAERGDCEVSGCGVGDGAPHVLWLGSYERPRIGGKNDDGDVSPGQALLKHNILVAGDKGIETGLFGSVQQLPVR
jgi:hypothetical protein